MNWKDDGNYLKKEITFKSQKDLAEFVLKVAVKSDELNHHADFIVTKAFHLEIALRTHDENKITEKDYRVAEFIDAL